MMREIELVVFDMAGTTVAEGGAVYRCLRETLSHAGLEVSAEAVKEMKGMAKNEALRLLVERSEGRDQFLDRLPELHHNFVDRLRDFYRTSPAVSEMPGASETFRRLQAAGVMVALNTGFSRDIVDSLLERLGWAESELVNATVTSDEVAQGRPHADMIKSLMRQLNITDARRIAKVGDTPIDLLEGKNAGCGLTIGVTKGSSTREELERYPHDHLIGTVAELPEILGI
jgi:phosphonatase-like hydrolase